MFPGEIHCLYEEYNPLAFVFLREENNRLSFVFGGMDYTKRNQYDLYINMLIFIIKECIKRQCLTANLGQTAEDSKLRLGAVFSRQYFCIFSRSKVVNTLLRYIIDAFSYKIKKMSYSVWKAHQDINKA
jgi:hypothetical protein